MLPQCVKATIEEGCDALLHGRRFFFELFLPWRKKKNEFGVGEGLRPAVDVVWIAENVIPNGVF